MGMTNSWSEPGIGWTMKLIPAAPAENACVVSRAPSFMKEA
jgi:hypothetical protein